MIRYVKESLVRAGCDGSANEKKKRVIIAARFVGKRRVVAARKKHMNKKKSLCNSLFSMCMTFLGVLWSFVSTIGLLFRLPRVLFSVIANLMESSMPSHTDVSDSVLPKDDKAVFENSGDMPPLHHLLRGGMPGGSAATARKRNEQTLLKGLQELLAKCQSTTSDEDEPHDLSPQTSYRSDSWVTVVKKKPPKDKPKLHANLAKPDSPSLLSDLQVLVNTCLNTKDTSQLLKKLTLLVEQYSKPPKAPGPRKTVHFAAEEKPFFETKQPHSRSNASHSSNTTKSINMTPKRPPKLAADLMQKFCNFHVFNEALGEGRLPDKKYALVRYDNVMELKEIAQMHNLTDKYALVVWDTMDDQSEPCDGAKRRWVSTANGASKMWFVPLASELPDDLLCEPTVHQAEAPTTEELTPLRVMAYQAFLPTTWKDVRKDPMKHFFAILPAGLDLRTYGWRECYSDGQAAILGYAKVPSSCKDSIIKLGGRGGWFIEPLKCNAVTKESVAWIPREDSEDSATYFRRVLAQATQNQLPMATRRGGGANLGLRGATNADKEVVKWSASAIPNEWQPGTLQKWLEKQGWSEIKYVTPPNSGRGRWTFAAKKPANHTNDCPWVCTVGSSTVTISRWIRKKPQYSEQRLPGFNKWYQIPQPIASETSVAQTPAIGVESQPEKKDCPMENSDEERNAAKRHKPASPSKADASASPQKPPAKKNRSVVSDLGPGKTKIWDLAGGGDCGYRSIAAAIAARSGKPKSEIESKISEMGTTVKARAISWLKQNRDQWEPTWVMDPASTRVTEGGDVPTNAEEYLKSLSRPARWIDGLVAQAVASSLKTDILVWERRSSNKRWTMTTRIRAEKDKLRDPIILLLENEHYRTIEPDSLWPEEWKRATPDGNFARGSGKSSSLSSWMKPGSTVKKKTASKDCETASDKSWLQPGSLISKQSCAGFKTPIVKKAKTPNTQSMKKIKSSAASSWQIPAPTVERKPKMQNFESSEADGVWTCPHCHTRFTTDDRTKLAQIRWYHLTKKHPHADRGPSTWVRPKVDVVTATKSLPPEERNWVCPFCTAALPHIEGRRQHRLSVEHHYKTAHKHRKNLTANAIRSARAKLLRKNPEVMPNARKGLKAKAKLMMKEAEKKAQIRDKETGHLTIYVHPDWKTWPRGPRAQMPNLGRRLRTCTKCWATRSNVENGLKCPSKPRYNESKRKWWRRVRDSGSPNVGIMLRAWNTTLERVDTFLEYTSMC